MSDLSTMPSNEALEAPLPPPPPAEEEEEEEDEEEEEGFLGGGSTRFDAASARRPPSPKSIEGAIGFICSISDKNDPSRDMRPARPLLPSPSAAEEDEAPLTIRRLGS